MDIHEYQAKDILARFGVSAPRGGLAYSPEQAAYRAREIGGNRWIVKAQVHTGGRGQGGGGQLGKSGEGGGGAGHEMFGQRRGTPRSRASRQVGRPALAARWSTGSMSKRR